MVNKNMIDSKEHPILSQVLDWLCLSIPHDELPILFKDKIYSQEDYRDISVIVPKAVPASDHWIEPLDTEQYEVI